MTFSILWEAQLKTMGSAGGHNRLGVETHLGVHYIRLRMGWTSWRENAGYV